MTANQSRPHLSRFDLIVLAIAATLVILTALIVVIGTPRPLGPAVAYLHPATGGIPNVWVTPLDDSSQARQVTFSETGVYNFDPSPDGRYIAYAERDTDTGLHEIRRVDLATGQVTALTNCIAEDSDCRTPVYRSDGRIIAYERLSANSAFTTVGPGALRIWLLDVDSNPPSTGPLTQDAQVIGHSPVWSRDGGTLAFYSADIANPGILVFEVEAGDNFERELKFVPSNYGTTGALSPDGTTLAFPEIEYRVDERDGEVIERVATYLRLADLEALSYDNLTDPDGSTEDSAAVWHPDGQRLTIQRRSYETDGARGYQIFELDLSSSETSPLVVDDRYSHGFFAWNADGTALVLQRFELRTPSGDPTTDAKPEIWMYDTLSDALQKIAEDAFLPRWVNSSG